MDSSKIELLKSLNLESRSAHSFSLKYSSVHIFKKEMVS
jgi:hypothetical protein